MGDATRILAGLEQGDPAAAERLLPLVYDELRGLAAQKLAHEDLRRALALQQELVDDFPAVRDYRHDLFRSHKTLGWLLGGSNRPEKAEIAFRKAAATGEKLAADYPSVHYYLGGLAEMYYTLGEFRARTGRLPDAEDAFRKSIALYERLVAEFPSILSYGPDLRETYFHLASLLKATNRPEESANVYRKARQVEDDEPQELQRLAWLLVSYPDAQLRDPSLAIELAKKATRLSPQNAKHWRTLGALPRRKLAGGNRCCEPSLRNRGPQRRRVFCPGPGSRATGRQGAGPRVVRTGRPVDGNEQPASRRFAKPSRRSGRTTGHHRFKRQLAQQRDLSGRNQ